MPDDKKQIATTWENTALRQRIAAANYDCMRHPLFSVWAGVIATGEITLVPDEGFKTAGTDGEHVWYSEQWIKGLTRKQLRAVVLHENAHKALKHCIRFKGNEFAQKNREIMGLAVDFVVNAWLEQADPKHEFFDWPQSPPPLLDQRYFDKSVEQVVMDLLRHCRQPQPQDGGEGEGGQGDSKPEKQQGKGKGKGKPKNDNRLNGGNCVTRDDITIVDGKPEGGETMDDHMEGQSEGRSDEDAKRLDRQMEEALRQGKILSNKLRSEKGTGGSLNMEQLTESEIDWREALREFVQEVCKGTDIARWSKINTRMFSAAGTVLPTLYDERIGEIVIACDTSGSMGGVYPLLFGETARIARMVKPSKLRLIWWDTCVAGEQEFSIENYEDLATQMKPAGGGGTDPAVVYEHLRKNGIKPQCIIFISDGYIGAEPANTVGCPVLWVIIDNKDFASGVGKTLHINSMSLKQ